MLFFFFFFTLKICGKGLTFIPQELQKTVTALVLSKLNYCNALYTNMLQRLLNELQMLQLLCC